MRISHFLVLGFSFVSCSTALSQPRRAELSFSGTTHASQALIQDVMRSVMGLAEDELNCPKPD